MLREKRAGIVPIDLSVTSLERVGHRSRGGGGCVRHTRYTAYKIDTAIVRSLVLCLNCKSERQACKPTNIEENRYDK